MSALTITVWADPDGPPQVWELTDPPPGGTHPRPEAAVQAIEAANDPFSPVPPGTISVQLWGGPERAHLEGEWRGRRVAADYSRTNGAEIARWNVLAAVFGTDG